MMLKLTGSDGASIWVAPQHICALALYSSGKTDVRFAGGSYLVMETPEQILAMSGMVMLYNPLMLVGSEPAAKAPLPEF